MDGSGARTRILRFGGRYKVALGQRWVGSCRQPPPEILRLSRHLKSASPDVQYFDLEFLIRGDFGTRVHGVLPYSPFLIPARLQYILGNGESL